VEDQRDQGHRDQTIQAHNPSLLPLLPLGLPAVLIGMSLEESPWKAKTIPFRQMMRNLQSKRLPWLFLYADQNRSYRLLQLLPPCL
jgi:hypothetical protein